MIGSRVRDAECVALRTTPPDLTQSVHDGLLLQLISLHTERANFASKPTPSVLNPIATQSHGDGNCCGELSIPWVCVKKDKWTHSPRCHANIHAVRSEVKSVPVVLNGSCREL